MTERRPFPPSSRRLALARQAGLTAASPFVVGALACSAAVLGAVLLARAAGMRVGGWIEAACRAADAPGLDASANANANALAIDGVAPAVLELAAPLLGAIAIVAFVAHVAQTRALWLPRRRVVGAPMIEPARMRHAAFEVAAAGIVGVVAFGWLWTTAPRLAGLIALEPTFERTAVAVAAAIASFVVALAIAWSALGVLDALLRRAELSRALAMTVTEKREDDRLAAADPRWRAQRLALARGPSASDAVAGAALVLLGDDTAVAIAWDARRQPVPLRTITGRGARATQLLGLARRHRVAVHRDPALAAALVGADGPVPDPYWAQLAEIIAAVQRPNTGRGHST
jgi:flagellar biosynthesis protein FlhB